MNLKSLIGFTLVGAMLAGSMSAIPAAAQSHPGGGRNVGGAARGVPHGTPRGDGRGHGNWRGDGHAWWGVGLGLGLGWDLAAPAAPYYYPDPTYDYPDAPPAVTVEPDAPTTSIDGPANAPTAANWYYCDSAKAYYPYVKQCPEQWRIVPATAPTQPPQ